MRDDALLALRLWRDERPGGRWRAQVTDLRSGAVARFADVSELVRYLSEAFAPAADAAAPAATSDDGTEA